MKHVKNDQARLSPASIRAVVFDFNDTISPTRFLETFEKYRSELPISAKALIAAYKEAGFLDAVQNGKMSEPEFWEKVSKLTGARLSVLKRIAADLRESRIVEPEMMAILNELRRRYRLALLTNNVQETFRFWVEKYGLSEIFDTIVNSADVGILKNDSRIYVLILRRLRCKPEQALLIDNEPSNLTIARSLGFQCMLFRNLRQLRKDLASRAIVEPLTKRK